MTEPKRRTAVLISGRGSNLAALVEAARAQGYPAEIALVLSDNPHAGGLGIARAAKIEAGTLDRSAFATRAAFEDALDQALRDARVELICLAGFMRVLSARFVDAWRGRMLNIHPSLLPRFRGLDTHARAIAAGAKVHGATVHFVTPELDSGPVVTQAEVPVLKGDTPETLAARVLDVEHRIYPEALKLVATGRAKLVGGHVEIDGMPVTTNAPIKGEY